MKIFLSALENNSTGVFNHCDRKGMKIPFGLVSYYYISKNKDGYDNFKKVLRYCDQVLVDSGAHSFQKGVHVPWEEYTDGYADFIRKNDSPKIVGYFEMDVDNQIGYGRVLQLRKKLTAVTNKIIPVWHKNRGIEEFKKMCQETKGRVVAVTGFKNEDIKDHQYGAFLKYAWKYGKKLHCLGMTRIKVLDNIPFDYVDSSSWKLSATYGQLKRWDKRLNKLITIPTPPRSITTQQMFIENLEAYIDMTRHYNIKWHKINNDLHFNFGVRNILRKIKLRRFLLWKKANQQQKLVY